MSEESQIPNPASEPENQQSQSDPTTSTNVESSWQEVGQQFQALGDSLAKAVRAAWENEGTQQTVQEMRSGVESMVSKVSKAIEDSANTPQGQQIREEAHQAAESLRSAGEQTVQEVRPQLINALQQVNTELQKLIDRMEQKTSASSSESQHTEPPAEPGPDTTL